MKNTVDYLEQTAHDSIYDRDFNELDMLILTELSYLPFEGIVCPEMDTHQEVRLLDTLEPMTQELSMMVTKNRLKLLEKAAASTRFKNIKMLGYINDVDQDIQKQFSAVIYRIKPRSYVLSFRGTDDSIVGWKEDFHMTYMDHVPAQKTAAAYLKQALDSLEGDFILTGHSKGGNLAAYAGSQIEPSYQERIQHIYSYDAPGLNRSLIEAEGYQAISGRIRSFIPQGSIIGMMLETPKQVQIVKSSALGGFAQHNTFSWQVEDDCFALLDSLNPDSLQTDRTLKKWVDTLSDEELKDFFDLFFGLILDAGITSINDLSQISNAKRIAAVIKNAQSLSAEEQERLTRLAGLLIDMRFQSWRDDISLPSASSIRDGLTQIADRLPFISSSEGG